MRPSRWLYALCALMVWACVELPGELPEARFDGGGGGAAGGGFGGAGGGAGAPDQGMVDAAVAVELCNTHDDDGDDSIDEGVRNACGACGPLPDEICDGYDNDCDLLLDEAPECACEPGLEEDCGADVGRCTVGRRVCSADGQWGPCSGEGPLSEACNDLDDDCDGDTDEDVLNPCGRCGALPAEVCNGEDDDCDGIVDGREVEGDLCACEVGSVEMCGSDVGACQPGRQVCRFEGWGPCEGAVEPAAERCNRLDDDCDGDTDEGACDCMDDQARPCGSDEGYCQTGTQTCTDGIWGPCTGERRARDELCNRQDDDCDGEVDEDACDCTLDAERPCGSNVGICRAGTQTCVEGGWGPCVGNVPGSDERCNGQDDDCDGAVDEDWPALGDACFAGQGDCRAEGRIVCRDGGTGCDAEPDAPRAELCNGADDDCDGQADEDVPEGPCDTGEDGICSAGTRLCIGGQASCRPDVAPRPETCNGADDDCDGRLDEGTGGDACDSGEPGRCAAGTEACVGGDLICVPNREPAAEACNGVDRDCDGAVDEGTGGGACATGEVGRCAAGVEQCQGGELVCVRENGPVNESCNGVDDDCDGAVDDPPLLMEPECVVRGFGICTVGVPVCVGGDIECDTPDPRNEACNDLDDDCDGETDEGLGGGECATGMPGACATGVSACNGGAMRCLAPAAQFEGQADRGSCNGVDDDCDGRIDEDHPTRRQCEMGLAPYYCANGRQSACAISPEPEPGPDPEPIPQ